MVPVPANAVLAFGAVGSVPSGGGIVVGGKIPYLPEALEYGWNEDPVGFAEAPPLAPAYFNTRKTSIYGGTNEIQRNIIAKMVLEL